MEKDILLDAANLKDIVHDPDVARLVIDRDRVISSNLVEGIEVKPVEIKDGVKVKLTVKEGMVIGKPVHLCFGVTSETAVQNIIIDAEIKKNASVSLLAHCVFPVAKDVLHNMEAKIHVGENANYTYLERHIHSDSGGIKVTPKTRVVLEKKARFRTEFELIRGRVGLIDIDIETICGQSSVMEMTARINGTGKDSIKIKETGYLEGGYSRGVLTSRVALRDSAKAEIFNKLIASGDHSRGHVDCKEIVQDKAIASAVPIVEVRNPTAHVTHEASIGSVDLKQLETLMSRGLSEDKAVDMIIEGLLS
jgi:uncharacterized protein